MAGRNIFEDFSGIKKYAATASVPSKCVFISHKSEDKKMARSTARFITKMGIDVYFDENDDDLRNAVASNEDDKIVECIDKGISHSTHLLGIITKRTFQSWWVPYEIGSARGQSKNCAHLIRQSVDSLPSYVSVAPILFDMQSLRKWIRPMLTKLSSQFLVEASVNEATEILSQYIPERRDLSNVGFF